MNQLKTFLKQEEEKSFQGWDFSYLENRWEEESLPWDYESLVKHYLKQDQLLLDMGTGGGEFLLSLNHPHDKTHVTEAWLPNVTLCQERLAPLGIGVHHVVDDHALSFESNTFDIIINRHEAYCVKEIKRILKPNGIFITQQVGGKNNERLSHLLLDNYNPPYLNLNLLNASKELLDNRFDILQKDEYFPYLRFLDVGAIVYFAKIIEWEFPGFSVEQCFNELEKLNDYIKKNGYYESYEHRFMLIAKNIKE